MLFPEDILEQGREIEGKEQGKDSTHDAVTNGEKYKYTSGAARIDNIQDCVVPVDSKHN